MRWGHAVSRDLLAWTHLPVAINHWDGAAYDCQPWPAIFSGSVTLTPAGDPVAFYSTPCQVYINSAVPTNRSDPLLVNWTKRGPMLSANESVTGGSGLAADGHDWGMTFRDPTTAWPAPATPAAATDATALTAAADTRVGEKMEEKAAGQEVFYAASACMNGTCLSRSEDGMKTWDPAGWFHEVPGSGTWECPDVFTLPKNPTTYGNRHRSPPPSSPSSPTSPSTTASSLSSSSSSSSPSSVDTGIVYVLKANTAQGSTCPNNQANNWWTIGEWKEGGKKGVASTFTPITAEICGDGFSGVGNHFDYNGLFYASKSFHDPTAAPSKRQGGGGGKGTKEGTKGRQILIGWVKENDPADNNKINMTWQSIASIPREIEVEVRYVMKRERERVCLF